MRLPAMLAAATLVLPASAAAQAPQSPVAAGPLTSILEVIGAAHRCGVYELRVDTDPAQAEGLGEARLYLAQMPRHEALSCLSQWVSGSGKRLKLRPRFMWDTFTDSSAPTAPKPQS